MQLHYLLYVMIGGLVLNLIANIIWKYLPQTDHHLDKWLTGTLLVVCTLLLIFVRDAPRSDAQADPRPDAAATVTPRALPGTIIQGDKSTITIGTIINADNIDQLIIHDFDPPEIKAAKIARLRELLLGDIVRSLGAIDSRLKFVRQLDKPDSVGQSLEAIRTKLAPAAADQFAVGYRRLTAEGKIAALRQAFNSAPVTIEPSGSLLEVAREADLDGPDLRYFLNQLPQVVWASELVLDTLTELGRDAEMSPEWQAYRDARLQLAMATLRQRSEAAHLAALALLGAIGARPEEVSLAMQGLSELEPRALPDQARLQALQARNLEQLRANSAEHEKLLARAQELVLDDVEDYAALNSRLAIAASDEWHVVLGKARALRELGRVADAVAAFETYGRMFSESDPTAERYSRTAVAFTEQLAALDVTGGVYLYAVADGGAGAKAGFQEGDILIAFDGSRLDQMENPVTFLGQRPAGRAGRITFLRLAASGGLFTRHDVVVDPGFLGLGLMPI